MDFGLINIIAIFIVYYILIIIIERRVIQDPKTIIDKFLSVIFLYAGISLIYYSITSKPFFGSTQESYQIYIFIIGFISFLYTFPNLLKEFSFFQKFLDKRFHEEIKFKKNNTHLHHNHKLNFESKQNKTKK